MQGTEDVSACTEDLLTLGGAGATNGQKRRPAVLFGLYDGHCGRGAAEEAAAALPGQLAARAGGDAAGLVPGGGVPAGAWAEAFLATDAGLRSEEGCTATALLAWADEHAAVCLQVIPAPYATCAGGRRAQAPCGCVHLPGALCGSTTSCSFPV